VTEQPLQKKVQPNTPATPATHNENTQWHTTCSICCHSTNLSGLPAWTE